MEKVELKVRGVGRDAAPKLIGVSFSRPLSDDELKAFHEYIDEWPEAESFETRLAERTVGYAKGILAERKHARPREEQHREELAQIDHAVSELNAYADKRDWKAVGSRLKALRNHMRSVIAHHKAEEESGHER